MSPTAQAIADVGRLAARIESYADKAATGALRAAAQADFAESAILLARATTVVLAYHEEVVEALEHLGDHARNCASRLGADRVTCGPCDCGLDALLRKGRP